MQLAATSVWCDNRSSVHTAVSYVHVAFTMHVCSVFECVFGLVSTMQDKKRNFRLPFVYQDIAQRCFSLLTICVSYICTHSLVLVLRLVILSLSTAIIRQTEC